jgi:hypothetical protein
METKFTIFREDCVVKRVMFCRRRDHSVESISAHVGEQTKASNEIASNVAQANTGAKRVAAANAKL